VGKEEEDRGECALIVRGSGAMVVGG